MSGDVPRLIIVAEEHRFLIKALFAARSGNTSAGPNTEAAGCG